MEHAAYAERARNMPKRALETTLAQHAGLVQSDRWERLDEAVRAELAEKASVLQDELDTRGIVG